MASKQEMQVAQKRELEQKTGTKREMDKAETTAPSRVYQPNADIYETKAGLHVILEMPGVDKNSIDVQVEDGVLKVDGKLDFSKYQGLQPLYTEYNVGNFSRSFRLSSNIDQGKITAELKDGVLALVLPLAEQAKPRTIQVK
jgi:HSP20 family protein